MRAMKDRDPVVGLTEKGRLNLKQSHERRTIFALNYTWNGAGSTLVLLLVLFLLNRTR